MNVHIPKHDANEPGGLLAAHGLDLNRIPLFTISRNALANKQKLLGACKRSLALKDPINLYGIFTDRLLEQIRSFPVLVDFLKLVNDASDGEYYIFGGTLRRTLLSSEAKCDLDIMVPNGDERIFTHLERLRIPYTRNRRGHRRYSWKDFQFDINQPQEWREDFKQVSDALMYFDLRINSLAYYGKTGNIIDPNKIMTSQTYCDPSINWARWKSMPPLELAILAIRLQRILMESPQLRLKPHDVDTLRKEIVPVVSLTDWNTIKDRFPSGKNNFLRVFEATISSRSK